MSGRVDGKVALVTGAARGQGRSQAVRLAEEGADIIAVDMCAQIDTVPYPMSSPADLAEMARIVQEHGRRIVTSVVDVRDRAQLNSAVADAVAEFGRLDIVVANAGIAPVGRSAPAVAWLDAVQVNLNGVVNAIRAAFPHLTEGASIVCIGSMGAFLPGSVDGAGPGGAGYSHAKRAVARLVHDLAQTLAPHSIRVNAVHPGNIDTPMLHNDAMYGAFRPDLTSATHADAMPAIASMHRIPVETIEPSDISEAVLFLASDASRYITGQQLSVDGGAVLATSTAGAPG